MTKYGAHPGDGDTDAGLSEALTACVEDVRIPGDLLERAAARNRKRAMRNRLIGAASTAAVVAAVATTIASVPGRPAGHQVSAPQAVTPRAQTAAYILERAAAAEVNSYRLISVAQEPGSGTIYTDVATQQQRIVSPMRASSGQPYYEITDAIKGATWTDTTIENQHHVYAVLNSSTKDHGPMDAAGLTISSFLPLQGQSDPAAAFRAALKAGTITVAGHQNLNGRDTILIRVHSSASIAKSPAFIAKKRILCEHVARSCKLSMPPDDEIWIDATTYQVVQTKNFVPSGSGTVFGTATWKPAITRVTWLSPTPANLALLTATPPHGYTQVPYSQMTNYLGPLS